MPALQDSHSFKARAAGDDNHNQILQTYETASAVMRRSGVTLEDIETCSPRFWGLHQDPEIALDIGCANILACSYNLFLGTVAPVLMRKPDLLLLVDKVLKGEVMGNFMLTEVAHGLDIANLETTATRVADGFLLNTPHGGASKFFPPATPVCAKVAVVLARLIVDGMDRGIHPFFAQTADEHGMCAGVTVRLLPARCGTSAVDYAATSFHNVHLPPSAFLGESMDVPRDRRSLMRAYIWRTVVGQVTIGQVALTGMKASSYIGMKYSLRRRVRSDSGEAVPIMSFRTQQLPMLYITAITNVLDAWTPMLLQQFTSSELSLDVRQGLAAVFKTTVCRFMTQWCREVGERLGAQGTFVHNMVGRLEMDIRGFLIAEGDVTTIGIRLYSHLLQQKYSLPEPMHDDSLLAWHSKGVYNRCLALLQSFPRRHRDARFNNLILPQCQRGLLAIGCAYAYGCAVDVGVPGPLLQLFESAAIRLDPLWYAECAALTEDALMVKEDDAARAALPKIEQYVEQFEVGRAVKDVPILTDEGMEKWLDGLETYVGGGAQNIHLGGIQMPQSKL